MKKLVQRSMSWNIYNFNLKLKTLYSYSLIITWKKLVQRSNMSWNVFFQFFPGGWTFNVGCSRVQHGGDTSSPLLDRVREQTHTHNVPKGRDPQVQFLVDPRVDRVPVQPSRRMRLHAVLQEAEEGQGAHRGDRDGRRADHHRPLIFFFFFFF